MKESEIKWIRRKWVPIPLKSFRSDERAPSFGDPPAILSRCILLNSSRQLERFMDSFALFSPRGVIKWKLKCNKGERRRRTATEWWRFREEWKWKSESGALLGGDGDGWVRGRWCRGREKGKGKLISTSKIQQNPERSREELNRSLSPGPRSASQCSNGGNMKHSSRSRRNRGDLVHDIP